MVFLENGDLDLRRYNQPTSKTEVAAIFVGDNREPPANRDTCIYPVDTYSKFRTKDDIDKYVSAKLPDPIADPTLFRIITICMIHGPCRTLNPNSQCMREGVCTKQYPKEFREKTEENINGYPMYQGKCTKSVRVDGRYVSAPEAMWRLNEFNLSDKSHTVVRLAVHLPDQQAIV
ncbi:hypothetical protein AVEN_74742-1 [Araneus ventricosus]|uniref:Uncharacterized protein n=1 Tax=Araneus ventricosus TaxID=182803 RepID=A0A4Y2TH13_ARAVE|nr:hypothetical protein AVEN_74742-1 [Araneus ventricosus]